MRVFSVPALPFRVSVVFLLARVIAGFAFMHHGWGKIQVPFAWMGPGATTPPVLQALAALSEFGGGFAWVLGLLMPLASSGIAATMAVAVWTHMVLKGDPFVGHGSSYELAAVYFSLALVWIAAGPGAFSLDRVFFGKR